MKFDKKTKKKLTSDTMKQSQQWAQELHQRSMYGTLTKPDQ